MPAPRLDEVRLPELRLPELSRGEIVRALNDARHDVDLARFDPRRLDLPEVQRPRIDDPRSALAKIDLSRVDLPAIDLTKIDLPNAVAVVAKTAGLVRAPRARWPWIVAGVVTVAVVGAAIVASPTVRPRLEEAARRWRARLDARRSGTQDAGSAPSDPGIVAVPIEPSAYAAVASDGPAVELEALAGTEPVA